MVSNSRKANIRVS